MSGLQLFTGNSTSTKLPPWVEQAGKDIYGKALNFYNQKMPTPPTASQRVAPLNSTQQNAMGAITNPGSYDTADLSSSIDATKRIESSIPSLTNVGNVIDSSNLGSIGSYMNPYTEQAIAPAIADINRSSDAQRKQIGANAFAAGAFGDARQGVTENELNRTTQTAIGDTASKAYDASFNEAMGERQNDLSRLLSGNISGIQLGLQGAAQQGQQALSKNQDTLSRLMAQLGVGNVQQQNQQSREDVNYQNYLMKAQSPYDKLAALMSVLSGTPYNRTTTTSSNPLTALLSGAGAIGGSALTG